MKKFLALLTAALLVVGCFGTTAMAATEAQTGLTIKASETTVEVGDTVDFTVTLNDCSKVTGGVYNVGFFLDIPEELEYVTGSGKLNPSYATTTGFDGVTFNEAALKVGALGALAAGYKGGAVDVITFSCKVVATGNATVSLTGANITDAAGKSLTPNVTDATVKAVEAHKHAAGTEWKYDATNHWNVCACGEKMNVAAHTWDAGKVTKEATVDAEGVKTFTCTVCKATKTESIAKLPAPTPAPTPEHQHAFGDWSADKDNHWKECACGEKAELGKHVVGDNGYCTVCGMKVVDGDKAPQTGDNSGLGLMAGICVVVVAGVAVARRRKMA